MSPPRSIYSAGDGRIELTLFTSRDITPDYVAWLNDRSLMRFSRQRLLNHDLDSCLAYLRSFDGTPHRFWAVKLRDSQRKVGTMTAYVDEADGTADLGILIAANDGGRGFGREAWGLAMDELLRVEELRKVTGGTVASNMAMLRIFLHWRMALEGIRREQQLIGDDPVDVVEFGILGRDWLAYNPQPLCRVS